MIKLKEIIHSIKNKNGTEKNNEGFINIDDWKWPDVDHLIFMKFDIADDYCLKLKDPDITIYKKKDPEEKKEYFYLEEPKKPVKRFEKFNDVIEFFDNYKQPEIDKNI